MIIIRGLIILVLVGCLVVEIKLLISMRKDIKRMEKEYEERYGHLNRQPKKRVENS